VQLLGGLVGAGTGAIHGPWVKLSGGNIPDGKDVQLPAGLAGLVESGQTSLADAQKAVEEVSSLDSIYSPTRAFHMRPDI
jgi:hypothetical protein